MPPTLVYLAELQPGLFSVYRLIHCTATRTLFSELPQTLLICHCLQCNQSCHQFVAKHTLVLFITDLGYFVSWGNYNDQTCFPLLVADISEFLSTAPAHEDKHSRITRKKGIVCATVVVYVSIESLDIDLCLTLVCFSGRKAYNTVEYFENE